jgi:hypothetical protein
MEIGIFIKENTTDPVNGITQYTGNWDDKSVAKKFDVTVAQVARLRQDTRGKLYSTTLKVQQEIPGLRLEELRTTIEAMRDRIIGLEERVRRLETLTR